MLAFLTTKIGMSVIGGGLIALVIGGGFLYVRSHYINVGYQRALAAVAAEDARAVNEKDEIKRHKVGPCFDRGGTWNVETGECEEKK